MFSFNFAFHKNNTKTVSVSAFAVCSYNQISRTSEQCDTLFSSCAKVRIGVLISMINPSYFFYVSEINPRD